MDWKDRISIDTNICHGKPCIRGTQIMVSVITDNLANKVSDKMLLKCYTC